MKAYSCVIIVKLKSEKGTIRLLLIDEGRGKKASANLSELSKNVTNLKPERFSRRALTQAVTDPQLTKRD